MKITLQPISFIEAQPEHQYSQPLGLGDFQYEISTKMRGVKFKARDSRTSWVYREGENYPMGYVGFGNFRDTADDEEHLYTVWSPNIINNRYQQGAQVHMTQAKHKSKGVANALKYLRPLTVEQTARISTSAVRHKVSDVITDARTTYTNACAHITHNLFDTNRGHENALQRELKHLLDTGYEFVDKEFGEKLRSVFNNLKEYSASKESNDNIFTFVEATKTITGRQVFRVATEVNTAFSYSFSVPHENISVYSQEELPDELAGKVAVLSMVDVETYVEGVGYRAADAVFYLR